jgi:glyoxylase I family protein
MFVDHIVLIISDVNRSKEFYSKFLGKPDFEEKESISYTIGNTKIFLGLPYKKARNNTFNSDRIGLNHLAFGVKTRKELKDLEKKLNKAKIKNSGIRIDTHGKKEYIWFDDPDKIRLEFYLREK